MTLDMLDHICLPIRKQLDDMEGILRGCMVSGVPLATEVARYTIANGGKRVRPAVFFLSSRLTGAPESCLPSIAAAMELVHTASLLHDDVVDDALLRRGKPSARAKWGNQISVLVGDFIWCCATSLLVESASPRVFDALSRSTAATVEGELLEITRKNEAAVDRETYLRIIGGKTAALFAACGRCGAIAGEVAADCEEALAGYGFDMGMAFQLADDVLDYTCCEKTLGKPTGADLREGKLTLPLIAALETATPDESKLIRSALIAERVRDDELNSIVAIVCERGGIDATMELARGYAEKAKAHLKAFRPSIERDALLSLADYAVQRKE
jgi:octaprenyl-diphosphate synthase